MALIQQVKDGKFVDETTGKSTACDLLTAGVTA